jgi:hypothetical protein
MTIHGYLPSFSDELIKIATAVDLMTPAVVSDSAAVDGPPATPFTRRKGYRKLTQTGPVKEASLRDFFHASKKHAKKLKKIPEAVNNKLIEGYVKAPGPVKAVLDDVVQNTSDYARIFNKH